MKNKELAKQEKHTRQNVLLICNTGQRNRDLVNFDFYDRGIFFMQGIKIIEGNYLRFQKF